MNCAMSTKRYNNHNVREKICQLALTGFLLNEQKAYMATVLLTVAIYARATPYLCKNHFNGYNLIWFQHHFQYLIANFCLTIVLFIHLAY